MLFERGAGEQRQGIVSGRSKGCGKRTKLASRPHKLHKCDSGEGCGSSTAERHSERRFKCSSKSFVQ